LLANFLNELRLMFFLNRLVVKQHLRLVFDWWLAVAGMVVEQGTAIAFLGIIFYQIDAMKGWSLYEMVFLLGLFVLSKPVYRVFFQGAADISNMVLNGTLDQILVRPRNALTLILTSSTNPVAAGDLLLGSVLLCYGAVHIEIDWSILRVLYILSVVACGSLVYVGTLVFKGVICVFLIRIEALNALLQQFQEYAKFPVSIYHPFIKTMLISFLPYGLASSVPAAIFLGKGGIAWIAWLAPLCCVVYVILSGLIFNWSLRFYKSSGS
jgi:ABC-2 type transport system permease protein